MTGKTDFLDYLHAIGLLADEDINVFEVAMVLAQISKLDANPSKYRLQMHEMIEKLRDYFDDLCGKMNGDGVNVQHAALEKTFAIDYGFLGDDVNYDDLKNINIFDVMDRRLGMPISLCLLAVHLCRAQGWSADGINFPGHFLMRLEKDGERIFIDPFQGCKILDAKDLRMILKRIMGANAELSATYYTPCTNQEMLLRLQNNIKYRLINSLDYQGALDCVETMAQIAPNDYRLDLDKAVLLSRLDQPQAAIGHLRRYIQHVSDSRDRTEAEDFLRQLQNLVN